MSEVTRILEAVEKGDRQAANELLPLVYDELRKLAANALVNEKPGQTLQPTALVHEAYLRLSGPANVDGFGGRRHFFGAAAEAMRRILVDQARRKEAIRHGGGVVRESQDLQHLPDRHPRDELLVVHESVDQLTAHDPLKGELVKLRYFAGLTNAEAAGVLGLSPKSAEKHWVYARAWLRRNIEIP